jgi:hypothetical protein
LREERRLRVFENRVLRRIFGPKRDEVTGSGEHCVTSNFTIVLRTKYYSGDHIKKTEMGIARSMHEVEERRGASRVLLGKPEGRRPLGRPRNRWGTILKCILEKGYGWRSLD